VVILQHPRERKVAIGTARMAHLALANSELLEGVDFSGHRRLEALAAEEGTYVLYPGEGAQDVSALRARPPRNVVLVDGTWPQARKIIRTNPLLQRLPRIAFTPERPSNYRIRREPAFHCVSTVEAVVEVLGQLEGERERLTPMLAAFARMVDMQLEAEKKRVGPPRKRVNRPPPRVPPLPAALAQRPGSVVCFFAEANAHQNGMGLPPELVHLVAVRPFSGERLEVVVRPRKPLWESTPFHIGMSAEQLADGVSVPEALARWRAFVREGDLLCTWGVFSQQLLEAEGVTLPGCIDVRLACAQWLKRRPGTAEAAAEALGEPATGGPLGQGRAGQRLAAMVAVVTRLSAEAERLRAPPVKAAS
jgi:DTW domain-containing protein YfiP